MRLIHVMFLIALALVLLLCGGAATFAGTLPQPTELRLTGSHLLNVPAFSSWDQPKCDDNHGLYYRPVISGGGATSSVLVRIDTASEVSTIYKLPEELTRERTALMEFFVTPSGHTYFLEQFQDGHYAILAFSGDGEMTSKTDLETPQEVLLDRFAVAEDGIVLVGGFFTKYATGGLAGTQYLAVVDRVGKERKRFGSDILKKLNLSESTWTTVGNPVVVGNDGNFYYVEGNKILVISEWGDIVRDMPFESPSGSSFAVTVALSQGLLSLQFDEKDATDPHLLRPEFLVLQTATGAPFALYRPSDELGTACLCFSRTDGYLFQKIENGKIRLLTAELR